MSSSNSDDLTPQKMLFMIVYIPIFFSIFVGIPCFTVRWILGSPPHEWSAALLLVASLFLFGPVCHRMRALCPPWQRFHAWAYKNKP